MTELWIDILKDACLDTVKLLPFLYCTYLLMEYMERHTQEHSERMISRVGRIGPLFGALAGILPQCGFSAAAASLYAGGVISVGTLLAVFLSTSDEMLAIFLSEAVPAGRIIRFLLAKLILGAALGFLVDLAARLLSRASGHHEKHIHDLCEQEHCGCEEEGSVWKSALIHTLHIGAFIWIANIAITALVETGGEAAITAFLGQWPSLGVFLCALIGLIPNCAASVMLSELYLQGLLTAGQTIAGLLVGAGVGLLVLWRTNKNLKDNLLVTVVLYLTGTLGGLIVEWMGLPL